MKHSDRLMRFFLVFSLLTVLLLPLSALLPDEDDADIYNSVIRLHVIAHSDSDADQAMKLRVRDGILSTVSTVLVGADTVEDAAIRLEVSLSSIREAANAILAAEGSPHTAEVCLTREVYPTRVYEDGDAEVRLPAGEYTSLQVKIGSAAGKNWWCVLFPQLCIRPASARASVQLADDSEEKMIEAGLTRSQIRLITGKEPEVIIRFRLLEWFKKTFG